MNIREKVEQYLTYCEFRRTLDKKTVKAYQIDLRKFFDAISSEEPSKVEIENYIMKLHKTYKQKTVKRKIASIKAFYNYLEEEELIEENPFRKIKVKFKEDVVLPRIVPREEIEKLLNFMYAYPKECERFERRYWLRDIAIVEVIFGTGARVYEISNIREECVNLNTGLIKIMGKGGKERYVQISDKEVVQLLREYYEANMKKIKRSGYFFISKKGTRYTEQSIRLMIKKYAKLAGIERNITPHMFRHSFATYLIEEDVDISCVKEILGHSSIQTTQVYLHVAFEKQAEILRMKHPRNRMHIVRRD